MKTHGPNDADVTHQTKLADLPAFLTVPEVQRVLRIGKSAAYQLARDRGVRFGGIVRVPREALTSTTTKD
jgi:hypothetical protein